MIGLIIVLISPFIYFYMQMNNFNQKTDTIKKAINEKKEINIDPLTGKMHWTKNGALVMKMKLDMFWISGNQKSIPGDEVLIDLNTDEIYKNYSRENFVAHVQEQMKQGKCWCGERKEFRDKGYLKDNHLKYHIKQKYFYKLEYVMNREIQKGKLERKITIHCYQLIYNPTTNTYNEKYEIDYKKYKELGGEK